ncbi:MAG TPA: BatA domain-containing protein [Sphingobacteriaceae bacterium]
MLQFLQSIWLIAAAGMIIPVLIHFWNVKRGKTMKVGSITFLQESSRQNGRSLRLRDLLLLVLRCLIILVIAVILAGPAWRTVPPAEAKKGWILIEKQNRKDTYAVFKHRIDSLLTAGYELHDFNPGFARAGIPAETLAKNEAVAGPLPSYWTLLKELERQAPPDVNLCLFTPNRLSRLAGRRPEIRLNMRWETYVLPGESAWISGAHLVGPDKIRVTRSSVTSEALTNFTQVVPAAGTADIGTTFRDGVPQVFLKNDTSRSMVPADTLQTRITVYSDQAGDDMNYLRAALEAITGYSERNIRILYRRDARQIDQNEDWIFWLSEKPVPTALKARNRFIYQAGQADPRATVIRTQNGFSGGTEALALFRKVNHPGENNAESVWLDGFGRPVLAIRPGPGSLDYLFYSRFDPAWNQLVWSPQFPAILYGVLFGDPPAARGNDLRKAAQLLPEFRPVPADSGDRLKTDDIPLDKPLYLLAFLLFSLERLISYYRGRRSHG